MPINIYDKPADAQFINTYERMPVDAMMQATLASQDRWDRGEALEADILDSLNVDALKKRTPQKQAAIAKITDEINKIVSETGNEYHKALPKLENLHKKVKKELTAEGELGGLQAEYNQRVAYAAKLQKMIDRNDGTMNEERKAELLTEADRRHGLTTALGKDEYGTWTKDQWTGLSPVDVKNLPEILTEMVKEMPMLTEEGIGEWLQGKDLPPGMYQKINTILKSKGPKGALRQILHLATMSNPELRAYIEQSVELQMGQLEAQEAAVPGTRDSLFEQAIMDMSEEEEENLTRELEEAGIDPSIDPRDQEGGDIIYEKVLRQALERGLMESILAGPIEAAVQLQGGTDIYDAEGNLIRSGVIEQSLEDKHYTPPKHISDGGDKTTPPGFPTVIEQGVTMTAKTAALGESKEEIAENLAKRKKEALEISNPLERIVFEEDTQKMKNATDRRLESLSEETKKILKAEPSPPEFLNKEQLRAVKEATSDAIIGDPMYESARDLPSSTTSWAFDDEVFLSYLAEKIIDDDEFYNTFPESVRTITKEIPGIDNLTSLMMEGAADLFNLGQDEFSQINKPTGAERDKRVKELKKHLLDYYNWQETGGIKSLEEEKEILSEDEVPIEESNMHSFGIEATAELQTTVDKMSKRIAGNLGSFEIVNAGSLGKSAMGQTLADLDEKVLTSIDKDQIKITGFIGPTELNPKGVFKIQVGMKGSSGGQGIQTTYITPTVAPNEAFPNLYTELIKNLDVGPEWIQAMKGHQYITTNFNLKEKFGLENDIVTEFAEGTQDKYTIKINDEALSIAEALDILKIPTTGKYGVAVMQAMTSQLLNSLANSGLDDSKLSTIQNKMSTEGLQGLQSLDKSLQKEVTKVLNETPYIFDNKGIIYDNLGKLDNYGSSASPKNIPIPSKNIPTSSETRAGARGSSNIPFKSQGTATTPVAAVIQPRTKAGGSPANNNNIGNIKDVGFEPDSVLGKDTVGHAVFATPEAGWSALQQKVQWWRDGNSRRPGYKPTATLAEMSKTYAESPDDLKNLLGFLNKLVDKENKIISTDKLGDVIDKVGIKGFANAIAAKESEEKYLAYIDAKIIKKNLYI